MPRQYPPEFRQRALRMLEESMPEHETEYAAIRHVGARLGVGPETLRKWRRRAEIDTGQRPGLTSDEHAEVKRLRREVAELRRQCGTAMDGCMTVHVCWRACVLQRHPLFFGL